MEMAAFSPELLSLHKSAHLVPWLLHYTCRFPVADISFQLPRVEGGGGGGTQVQRGPHPRYVFHKEGVFFKTSAAMMSAIWLKKGTFLYPRVPKYGG